MTDSKCGCGKCIECIVDKLLMGDLPHDMPIPIGFIPVGESPITTAMKANKDEEDWAALYPALSSPDVVRQAEDWLDKRVSSGILFGQMRAKTKATYHVYIVDGPFCGKVIEVPRASKWTRLLLGLSENKAAKYWDACGVGVREYEYAAEYAPVVDLDERESWILRCRNNLGIPTFWTAIGLYADPRTTYAPQWQTKEEEGDNHE